MKPMRFRAHENKLKNTSFTTIAAFSIHFPARCKHR